MTAELYMRQLVDHHHYVSKEINLHTLLNSSESVRPIFLNFAFHSRSEMYLHLAQTPTFSTQGLMFFF